jgi:hypothetical protein
MKANITQAEFILGYPVEYSFLLLKKLKWKHICGPLKVQWTLEPNLLPPWAGGPGTPH